MDAKFTTRSQEALGSAFQSASAAGNPQLEPAHILDALLQQEGGVANGLLDAEQWAALVGGQGGTRVGQRRPDEAPGATAGTVVP